MTLEEVGTFLRSAIAEKAEIPADFGPQAKFKSELDIDSLVMLEVIVDVEKKFQVKIPEDKYGEMSCLDAAAALVVGVANKSAA